MKRIFLFLLLIFIWISGYSEPSRKITWEHVTGAWGYALEIKDSAGNIIVNTEIQDNFYSVSKFEPGEYSFRISTLNLLKQKGESTYWNKFTVEKLYIPQLKSVSKKQLISSYTNANIVVIGKNLRPDSRFLLRGKDKEIEITDIEIISDREAVLSYEPSDSLQGKFDIVIVNRGDVESVLKDAIEIVKPADAATFWFIGAGYSMRIPAGTWSEYLAPSYMGCKAYLQFSVKNPFFENFLFETELEAVQYMNNNSMKKSSLLYGSLGFGAGYYYPFHTIDLEMFIKFNAGPVYSVLTLDENLVDKKTTSIDWFVMAGTGLRFYMSNHFFIEPACYWKTVFYTGEYLYEQGVSFSAGLKI